MKLYTITATPVRKYKQLGTTDQSNIDRRVDTLHKINQMAVEVYPDIVANLLNQWGIDGFTIYRVDGYWRGEPEASFKIELAGEFDDKHADTNIIRSIADALKKLYNQDSVMLTLPDNTVEFI